MSKPKPAKPKKAVTISLPTGLLDSLIVKSERHRVPYIRLIESAIERELQRIDQCERDDKPIF
jgi:predicted DNA binding CopG/RHH family protein